MKTNDQTAPPATNGETTTVNGREAICFEGWVNPSKEEKAALKSKEIDRVCCGLRNALDDLVRLQGWTYEYEHPGMFERVVKEKLERAEGIAAQALRLGADPEWVAPRMERGRASAALCVPLAKAMARGKNPCRILRSAGVECTWSNDQYSGWGIPARGCKPVGYLRLASEDVKMAAAILAAA